MRVYVIRRAEAVMGQRLASPEQCSALCYKFINIRVKSVITIIIQNGVWDPHINLVKGRQQNYKAGD